MYVQQKVLRDKVNSVIPELPEQIRRANKLITKAFVKIFRARRIKPRILAREHFIAYVCIDVSMGSWSMEIHWRDVSAAINDGSFWSSLRKERYLHLQSRCGMCIYL